MPDIELLTFSIRGKETSRWYDFETHRFVRVPGWVKAFVWYEGTAKGSYHIDCMSVRQNVSEETEDFVRERVAELVMNALNWQNWEEIEMNLGLTIEVTVEDDGFEEDMCEVWRV